MIANAVVSIDEFRQNLAQIVGRVMYGQDRILIKKYDRDAAVLMSTVDYEKLLDPTKRLSKSDWNNKIAFFDSIKKKTNQDGLEEAVDVAVKAVRTAKKND